jgi:hypothetical protein
MRSEAEYPAIRLQTVCNYARYCTRCGMIRCGEAQRTVKNSRSGGWSRPGRDPDLYTLSRFRMNHIVLPVSILYGFWIYGFNPFISSNSLRGHSFYKWLERYRLEDPGRLLYVGKSDTVVAKVYPGDGVTNREIVWQLRLRETHIASVNIRARSYYAVSGL